MLIPTPIRRALWQRRCYRELRRLTRGHGGRAFCHRVARRLASEETAGDLWPDPRAVARAEHGAWELLSLTA